MSKRTQTKDVFDRLTEPDDPPDADEADDPNATEPVAAESDSQESDERRAPRRRRRRIVVGAVTVVVVATLGLSAFLGWRLKQLEDTAAAGRAALEAARSYAVTLTTLDSEDIDKNFNQTLAGATGEFKDAYSQGATQLRQVLIDNKAAGKGIVVDAAVKSATKTEVEVLLFVDQSITNAVTPSPRIDRNRVRMTMKLVDDRWLASKVEII